MLRYLTAGESHGPSLTAIIEGLPANLPIDIDAVNHQLWRRQQGHGRGFRMKIESDTIELLSGVRFQKTIGTPVALLVKNRDYKNWVSRMDPAADRPADVPLVTKPRPGHADLSGYLKYELDDVRDVLERASARNTATLVAVGAIARQLLAAFGIRLFSHVVQIGKQSVQRSNLESLTIEQIAHSAEASPVRAADKDAEAAMMAEIDQAKVAGDTVGGVFEIVVTGVPVGLGSYAMPDRRLDALLAGALMGIQAIKGVEIGLGFATAGLPGSRVHDAIYHGAENGYYRDTNGAGGIEGGVSNGEPIVVRAAMKPIPTLYKPLDSVDVVTKEAFVAAIERSDACAVPAAAVVGENVTAFVIAQAFVEKFGGDSLQEMERNYNSYLQRVKERS